MSSDDHASPLKANARTSGHGDSDLDTSSLSSDGENESPPQPAKHSGPKVKFTKKKAQPKELAENQVSTPTCDSCM